MTDSYAIDPVKEKAREEIFKFADRYLPRDRSQTTALYLASTNDRESKLLDRLGILRSNRVILEGDPLKVKTVELANPDIRVLPITTHDFFEKEAQKYPAFGYCGLDYECQLNGEVSQDLVYIAKNNSLINEGIIYVNTVGMRENTDQKLYYFMATLGEEELLKIHFGRVPSICGPDLRRWEEFDRILTSNEFIREVRPRIVNNTLTDEEIKSINKIYNNSLNESAVKSSIDVDKIIQFTNKNLAFLREIYTVKTLRNSLSHMDIDNFRGFHIFDDTLMSLFTQQRQGKQERTKSDPPLSTN